MTEEDASKPNLHALPVEMDAAAIWEVACGYLRQRLSKPSFETWLSPLVPAWDAAEGALLLQTDSQFFKDRIKKHHQDELRQSLEDAADAMGLDAPPRFEVLVVPNLHEGVLTPLTAESTEAPVEQPPQMQPVKSPGVWTPRANKCALNPRYTFDHFVVGQHNRFCHAAALAVAESPGHAYNPLFLYGGVGLGKTHLMQAIGHFALTHFPDLTVRYVTTEAFTNDLIQSIGSKEMKQFRDKYRRIDILMLDDVQFLEGKDRTQEEVFHTFNALHESGKQIIVASDRPPKHLSRLEERLKSRFEWGLIADIQPPDIETRLAILQQRAKTLTVDLGDEILGFVAEHHPNNIRELEGALNKVAAYFMLTRTLPDLEVVQSLLGKNIDGQKLSFERILDVVAQYYHVTPSELKSPSRAKELAYARHVAIYIIRELTGASYPKIGQVFGGRKHTTVLYAYEKLKQDLAERVHPSLARQIKEIQQRL